MCYCSGRHNAPESNQDEASSRLSVPLCLVTDKTRQRLDITLIYQLSLKDAPNCASRSFGKCTTLITS